jgi:4-amino-4-deoxy-L-arabinose transferase-like glycosyltransferase
MDRASAAGGTLERLGAREAAALLAVVAVAAALRVARWDATDAIFNDGPAFLGIAQAMEAGEWGRALAHAYHPLYSFATLAAHLAAGAAPSRESWESAAVAVSIASGIASVVLLWALVRRLFCPTTALVAALLLAFHPTAVRHSADVQSDGLYLALFLASALFAWRALDERRAALAAWAGAFAGLAYLVRPEGLGVALVAGALGALRVFQRRWSPRDAAPWAVALVAGALLVMAPYLVAMRVDTGAWQLTKKKSIARLAGAGAPYYPPAETEEATPPSEPPAAGAAVPGPAQAAEPAAAPARWPRAVLAARQFEREAIGSLRYEMLLLVALGVWLRRGRPGEVGVFVLAHVGLYAIVLYALALNAGYVSKRHVVPPASLAFGYAALGVPALGAALVRAARRLTGRRGDASAPVARALAIGLGLALVAPFAVGKNFRGNRDMGGAQRGAAEWLAEQPLAKGPVAADKVRVAYYAGAGFVSLRDADVRNLAAWLQGQGARYLITDTAEMSKRPALAAATGELELLHAYAGEGGVEGRVFAVPRPAGGPEER